MNTLWKDFLVAIRQFRRQPAFASAVVATLALAIGASIAVFSVVNAVLFRALPFIDPERLVWIASVRSDNSSAPFTIPEFMDCRSQTRALSGISAFASWSARLAGDEITEGLQGVRISANAFDVLGVAPVAGRTDSREQPLGLVLPHPGDQRCCAALEDGPRGVPGLAPGELNGQELRGIP